MAGKHALEKADQGNQEAKDRTVDRTTVARMLKHPAAAPTAVTVVAIALVMGMGWLNRTSEVGPASLATPLGQGRSMTSEGRTDDGQPDGRGPTDTTGPVLATRGRRAVLVPTWMDLPLVTPALAVRPDAIGALIPGAEPTAFPASGPGSGSSGSGTGTTGTTQAGTGTTTGAGGGTTVTTVTSGTATTQPPDTTPTTQPPDTTPTTAPPDTTEPPPTTDTTATEPPPTTETIPTGEESTGGLLDVVDDLLDTVSPPLEPLPLL